MTQIVKTQIIDIDSVARSVESCSNGFRVVRKYAPEATRENSLLEHDLPRIVARGIEERDYLMVSDRDKRRNLLSICVTLSTLIVPAIAAINQ